MLAWSIFFRQSAYNDLLIALEEEELPDSFSIKDLRNKIYSYRVMRGLISNQKLAKMQRIHGEI